jgi:hypothetical protein
MMRRLIVVGTLTHVADAREVKCCGTFHPRKGCDATS